jgi:hypothetical protein
LAVQDLRMHLREKSREDNTVGLGLASQQATVRNLEMQEEGISEV